MQHKRKLSIDSFSSLEEMEDLLLILIGYKSRIRETIASTEAAIAYDPEMVEEVEQIRVECSIYLEEATQALNELKENYYLATEISRILDRASHK